MHTIIESDKLDISGNIIAIDMKFRQSIPGVHTYRYILYTKI